MARSPPDSVDPSPKSAIGTSRFVVPLLVYSAFAAIVYWMLGAEPALNIDHISYIRLANEIRDNFPLGDYWRSFNSVRAYGVILAYSFDWTGSHLVSLKLLLAAITVAYLFAFQLFMGLATQSRNRAMLFSLFSALFVSFGASIWGMTDFSASLNRTIIIPPVMVLVWFFFRAFATPWRYAIYPALILLSLLHLSALHVFLVFGVFEMLDFILRRRCRLDRNLAYFALALVASVAMQGVVEYMAAGTSGYVRNVVAMSVTSVPDTISSNLGPGSKFADPARRRAAIKDPNKLTNEEAWRIELLAFPWRNFPMSFATLATIALSYGVIFLLAMAGAIRAFRYRAATPLDRGMGTLALSVPLAAYGLQALLWAIRDTIPVLPVNFEEFRAINMIMIPSVYFIYRLYELAPEWRMLPRGAVRAAVMVAFALQPIVVIRSMPAPWREGLIQRAVGWGMLNRSDTPRMLYARQILGLAGEGRRFYYSSRPALEWLERNAGPNDKVLTNLNEFHMSRVKSVGPFLGVLDFQVWDVGRVAWANSLEAVDRALAAGDLERVLALARSLGATYVVVEWPVEDAAYRDDYYSIVRVP